MFYGDAVPQVLKDEVEHRIRAAALEVFAERGFRAAGMAEIARRARISAGNVYRYFDGKDALFEAVVPPALVERFRHLLRARVDAASGGPDSGYPEAAAATVDFALAHRHEVVILLGRAGGTRYAGLAAEVVGTLVGAALRHAEAVGWESSAPDPLLFALEEIYRSYVRAWVRLLERFPEEGEFREALAAWERYHLAGLGAFFA